MKTRKPDKLDIKQTLDDATESLDAATLSKLRQARYRALEQEAPLTAIGWLTSGRVAFAGSAVAATTAIAVFSFWLGVVKPQTRVSLIEDIELLAAADSTELYEQIDFYEWLESQQSHLNKSDAG